MKNQSLEIIDGAGQIPLNWVDERYRGIFFQEGEHGKSIFGVSSRDYCTTCSLGPCSISGHRREEVRDMCESTMSLAAMRHFAQLCAAGALAHSHYARDITFSMLATARGDTNDFEISDIEKLLNVAASLGIYSVGTKEEIAEKVALKLLEQFGQQDSGNSYGPRIPQKRKDIWKKLGIYPRGIDREIVETMHQTSRGENQTPEGLLTAAAQAAIADGWGSSMIAADVSDILFGAPKLAQSQAGLSAFYYPLIDALLSGQIRGIVGLVGCDSDDVLQNVHNNSLIKELIKEDILVIQTGSSNQSGLLMPEIMSVAGAGLRKIHQAFNIPPVIHLGSSIYMSRILTIAAHIAEDLNLNDTGQVPCVCIIPKGISEEALTISMYFASSGIPVIWGSKASPLNTHSAMQGLMENTLWDLFQTGVYCEQDLRKILAMTIKLIDLVRETLNRKGSATCFTPRENESLVQ